MFIKIISDLTINDTHFTIDSYSDTHINIYIDNNFYTISLINLISDKYTFNGNDYIFYNRDDYIYIINNFIPYFEPISIYDFKFSYIDGYLKFFYKNSFMKKDFNNYSIYSVLINDSTITFISCNGYCYYIIDGITILYYNELLDDLEDFSIDLDSYVGLVPAYHTIDSNNQIALDNYPFGGVFEIKIFDTNDVYVTTLYSVFNDYVLTDKLISVNNNYVGYRAMFQYFAFN